jgi:RloB-like protein
MVAAGPTAAFSFSSSTAISNPCFELWLVLHFQDQAAHVSVTQIQSICKKHLPGYKKRVNIDKLWSNRAAAMSRARFLDKQHQRKGTLNGNPSSGVFKLLEEIDASQLRSGAVRPS